MFYQLLCQSRFTEGIIHPDGPITRRPFSAFHPQNPAGRQEELNFVSQWGISHKADQAEKLSLLNVGFVFSFSLPAAKKPWMLNLSAKNCYQLMLKHLIMKCSHLHHSRLMT